MDEALPGHWVDRRVEHATRAMPRALWLRDAVAIAEALFLRADGPPPREHLTWLAHELDDYVAHIGARSKLIVRASFFAVSALAPIASGRGRPLHKLSLADRSRALTRLEHSPMALAVLAVRASLCILWYEHPANARAIGVRARAPRGAQ